MKTISTVKNLSKLAIVVSALAITVPLEARRGGSGGACSEGYDAGTRQMQSRQLQDGTGGGNRYADGTGRGLHQQGGSGLGQGGANGKKQGPADGSGARHKGANRQAQTATEGGE
jgi:hypothetical protein